MECYKIPAVILITELYITTHTDIYHNIVMPDWHSCKAESINSSARGFLYNL